ncbi:BA75_00560T0 [Komagataella pastoris]|uniref:BA75_00560T0 n=1 Tax=Komagataella pastoris TaxID=4922 RepID=A0A1B2J9S2_PICPA|nr:BA75_00560T0 [Komagataella pastoris]
MLPIHLFKFLLPFSLTLVAAEEKYKKLNLTRLNETYYAVVAYVGSDDQQINSVLIDTGSSDFWILDKSFCDSPTSESELLLNRYTNKESCEVYGSFDSDKSDTFQATDQEFTISYAFESDSESASGSFGIDQVSIGDIHLDEVFFGLVSNTSILPPTLGIGPIPLESLNRSYANFPYQMKKEGLIDVVAYSLSLGQTEGELLFGAIDHSKYNGTLLKTPILQKYEVGTQVLLTGVALTNGSSSVFNETISDGYIYFDSGTPISPLPSKQFEDHFKHHGWTYDEETMNYSIECGSEGEKFILDYTLEYTISGDIVIKVPFEQMVVTVESDGKCYSSVAVTDEQSFSFSWDNRVFFAGDEVLRNAYVVYNLETQELAIAPAANNPEETEEDIEIISEDFDIPEARDYSKFLEYWSTTPPIITEYGPSSTSSGSVSEETSSTSEGTVSATESSTSEDIGGSSVKPLSFWGLIVSLCQFFLY